MSERIIKDTMIRPGPPGASGPVSATGPQGPAVDTNLLVPRSALVPKRLTADLVLTSTANVFVPDLNVAMTANERWLVDFWFYAYSSIPAGAKFGLIGPTGTTLVAHVFGSTSGNTAMKFNALSGNGALSAGAFGEVTTGQGGWVKIEGTVTCGTTAGNLSVIAALAAAPTSGQTVILYANSKLRADRLG